MWPRGIAIPLNVGIDACMQHNVGYVSIALLVTVDTQSTCRLDAAEAINSGRAQKMTPASP